VELRGVEQLLMSLGNLQKSLLKNIRFIDASPESRIQPESDDLLEPWTHRLKELRQFRKVSNRKSILGPDPHRGRRLGLAKAGIRNDWG
jgi:hypothetical protein